MGKVLLLLVLDFLFLVSFIAFSWGDEIHFSVAAVGALLFLVLGIVVVRKTARQKIGGNLRRWLLLTGWSAILFLPSVILHNLFYALGTIFEKVLVLKYLTEGFHVVSFLVGVVVCPVGFMIGVGGSVIVLVRRKKMGDYWVGFKDLIKDDNSN